MVDPRPIGEILVGLGHCTAEMVESALKAQGDRGGLTGELYRQFAITISIAVGTSFSSGRRSAPYWISTRAFLLFHQSGLPSRLDRLTVLPVTSPCSAARKMSVTPL